MIKKFAKRHTGVPVLVGLQKKQNLGEYALIAMDVIDVI
jgi:hypothetical protein